MKQNRFIATEVLQCNSHYRREYESNQDDARKREEKVVLMCQGGPSRYKKLNESEKRLSNKDCS